MDIWSRIFAEKLLYLKFVSARTVGGGGQPNLDRCARGKGTSKSLKMCGHPLWAAPDKS